ncbi:energy-coupling factor transporter ATP-binding protein EcfA2 [Nonomuraea muscovyensis]|uniref:Energy-coupling factor transporter ATP-binding protein EcfA2 n=1 Tax=Nonomuraea muscovyensis TaxID=1124761 RepID=A0A7X0EZH3_9ACTN|nr:dynamin family protein [Nonomuraea muscovyensis]MBB6349803.1 energy-coupling factor transporter ATP-binding protein EcfA2 [Nonomuraea muscovyensis]
MQHDAPVLDDAPVPDRASAPGDALSPGETAAAPGPAAGEDRPISDHTSYDEPAHGVLTREEPSDEEPGRAEPGRAESVTEETRSGPTAPEATDAPEPDLEEPGEPADQAHHEDHPESRDHEDQPESRDHEDQPESRDHEDQPESRDHEDGANSRDHGDGADFRDHEEREDEGEPGDQVAPLGDTSGDHAESPRSEAPAEPPRRRGGEGLPPETVAALTAALDTLRSSVSEVRFGLDLPGAEEARQVQADLLAQLQDYVLPRVRTSTAPALIVVAGSTGAGKSTLVNSLAERNVSRTGVRRPTTGVPVLACHPDDRTWFAEGELLSGLRRIDTPQPGAGLDSLIVVPTEKLPQGVALLDTPDIDSVVEEHHEIAQRMLDAADLWVFVTTAARYADAPAWNLLRLAKERGARLAIVLSRVQPRAREVVLKHFVRMLTEYGLGEIDRFVIHESKVLDGRLPDNEVTDLRLWLAELSVDEERREQAVRETLNGVLNSFRTRVPALAKHMEVQVTFRGELRADVEASYRNALSEIDKAFRGGTLIHGEVLARWQDFAGSGDLLRTLHLRKRGRSAGQAPERIMAFRTALRAGLESVIVAGANRAAEEVAARWRHRSPLGAKLAEELDRPSDDLVRHASRAIAAWQEHVTEMVRTDGVAKRSVSKLLSFDADSLSLIFMVAMFSGPVEGLQHRLVTALLGAESLRGIGAKALSDLRARIGMLFDEESMRYAHVLDSVGIPDESIATRLYQATYNLEVAR